MKKSFLGIASVVPALMFAACSDDGSSTPTQDPNGGVINSSGSVVLPDDPYNPIPNTPVVNSSASNQPVVQPDPDENIADKPITEEDKKDDGTASVGSLPFSISGTSGIGPFVATVPVNVYSVDAKTMTETKSASATVSDKIGSYSASGTLSSAIATVEVAGAFYDFANNGAGDAISLRAITDLRERKTVNVNILTHLEYFRVQYLVAGQGMSFTAAKERAEKELLQVFNFKNDSTLFEDISLYDMTEASEKVLAISHAFLLNRSGAEVAALLETAAADFAQDGRWDDDASKAKVGDAAFNMDTDIGRDNLSVYNNDADVYTYATGKRSVWSGMFNLGSCSESNINEVKGNGNSKSSVQDQLFACREAGWAIASAAHVSNYQVAQIFGNCTEALQGTVKENGGKSYICKSNLWTEASAEDIAAAAVAATAGPCTSTNERAVATSGNAAFVCLNKIWRKTANAPIDYSKGRAMNKKLGRGINFGNSWDAPGSDDGGWSNPIGDGDFATVKAAGFNSVRIPVRWYTGMSSKLSGVKADVQLAINAGLTVIINNHHNQPVYDAAGNGSFDSKLNDFKSEWKQVAQAFESFPDDAIVFEIFNEPHDPMSNAQVNKLMTAGYETIRSISKGKTIMFEGNGYAKFAQIQNLELPADGNIIVSGHYYDPYSFTHQGHGDSYPCNANARDGISNMAGHFKSYADSAARFYPDVNGGSVPLNMGEFGVANKGQCQSVSDSKREAWVDAVVAQAEKYDMSWQYWCFKNCGGFEASNGGSWHGNMLNVFKKYFK